MISWMLFPPYVPFVVYTCEELGSLQHRCLVGRLLCQNHIMQRAITCGCNNYPVAAGPVTLLTDRPPLFVYWCPLSAKHGLVILTVIEGDICKKHV